MGDFSIPLEERHQISTNLSIDIPEYVFAVGACAVPGARKYLAVIVTLDTEPVVRYIVRHDNPEIVNTEIVCDTYSAAARIYNAI